MMLFLVPWLLIIGCLCLAVTAILSTSPKKQLGGRSKRQPPWESAEFAWAVNQPHAVAIGKDAHAVLPAPPAAVQRREDTFWRDVVGIPFDVWCALGDCTQYIGYVFPPGVIDYLEARRVAGDFLDPPVNLIKPPKIVPEPTAAVESAPFDMQCPYCGSAGGMVRFVNASDRYECCLCKGIFDAKVKPSPKDTTWAKVHGQHGIVWNRIIDYSGDRLTGTCLDCQEKWTHHYTTGQYTIEDLRPVGIQGIYRNLTEDQFAEAWKKLSGAAKKNLMILPPESMKIENIPPNPGLRRRA